MNAIGKRSWQLRRGWSILALLPVLLGGCNSFLNSWFDPTQMGNFSLETTLDIRTSLSIQDTPAGIAGATDPRPEDLIPIYEEYHSGPGDVLSIRIFELLARNTETTVQAVVDEIGTIALPLLGQVRVAGMTRSEITDELARLLRERSIIQDATIIVELAAKRGQTYVVFGATASPNLYPITRPDMRLLEALNTAGGLADIATEIYVIRDEERPAPGAAVGSSWSRKRSTGVSLADGFGGAGGGRALAYAGSTGAGQQEPPPEEEADLIDAAAPTTGEPPEAETEDAPEQQPTPPPAGQPRWIYVNGKWIPTTAPEEPPQEQTPAEARVDTEEPAAPPGPPPPEVFPQIDWDRLAGEQERRIIRISAQALRDGDYRQNIIVRPNDTIRILAGQVGEYYIMGQVNRPGAYTITGRQITLKTAIASAGNLAPLGWPDRCTIYRRYGDREEMHQVNLDAIFAGKEPDLLLKNNDLILVGTHPVAPFLAVFRNAFRMTYGFGFVYDRNFADIDSFGPKINPDNRQQGAGSLFPNLFR